MINKFENFLNIYENIKWDWVDEEDDDILRTGDKVIITDKLSDYIKEYGWVNKMFNLIGKVTILPLPNNNNKSIKSYTFETYLIGGFFIPSDCIKKI